MGREPVKVEIAPLTTCGWGKHFFYRMDGDESTFIAFCELHDGLGAENYTFDLNTPAKLAAGDQPLRLFGRMPIRSRDVVGEGGLSL